MDINLSSVLNGSVTVAGVPLSNFGAKMQSFPKFVKALDVETFQGRQRSTLRPIKNLISSMTMTARIDFFGSNATRTKNQSDFEALFRSQTETVTIDIRDGFFYRTVLLSATPSQTAYELITTVEYKWAVTRHTETVTVTLRGENTIQNPGNFNRTDCIITLNAGSMQGENLEIQINGFNVLRYIISATNNPNDSSITLDGINKTFKIGSANAVQLISWKDFPYLLPGENTIAIFIGTAPVSNTLNATVSFTPTYL